MPFKKSIHCGYPRGYDGYEQNCNNRCHVDRVGLSCCQAPVLELLYIFLYSLRALGTMSHSLKQQTLNLNNSITAMLKYLSNKLPHLSS